MNLSISFEQGWFWTTLVLVIIGYLFGTLLFSRLWISIVKKGDTRYYDKVRKEYRNQTSFGTTATGARGIQFGIAQFLLDFAKPLIYWFFVVKPLFLHSFYFSNAFITFGLVGVVAGNNYPIWWKFKGGQGIAVGVGSLFCINWLAGLVGLTAWAIVSSITGGQVYATLSGLILGSLVAVIPAAYFIPGIPWWYQVNWTTIIAIPICMMLVVSSHTKDYKRKIRESKKWFANRKNKGTKING